jgi:hypothetical protein
VSLALEVRTIAGQGNRRQVQLTATSGELVNLCGVDYRTYQEQTRRLLGKLEASPGLPRQQTE